MGHVATSGGYYLLPKLGMHLIADVDSTIERARPFGIEIENVPLIKTTDAFPHCSYIAVPWCTGNPPINRIAHEMTREISNNSDLAI